MFLKKDEYDKLLEELKTYKCVSQALQFENDNIIKENKEFKEEIKALNNKLDKVKKRCANRIEKIQQQYEKEIKDKNKGGRKKKFNDLEIESIKMYRMQGISIRELGKMFNCSIGTIHNIIKENNIKEIN